MATFPAKFPWGLGGDGTSSVPPTAESETFRLAQYIKGKPNMEAILDALGVQAEEVAAAFEQLDTERTLAAAFGAQLDVLGDIVGRAREGDTDTYYRAAISAWILLNNSSGGPEELYAIFALLVPTGATMKIVDFPPAAFVFKVAGVAVTDFEAGRLASVFRKARAAGVGGRFHWTYTTDALTFTFDGTSAQALDMGLFSGAVL